MILDTELPTEQTTNEVSYDTTEDIVDPVTPDTEPPVNTTASIEPTSAKQPETEDFIVPPLPTLPSLPPSPVVTNDPQLSRKILLQNQSVLT